MLGTRQYKGYNGLNTNGDATTLDMLNIVYTLFPVLQHAFSLSIIPSKTRRIAEIVDHAEIGS